MKAVGSFLRRTGAIAWNTVREAVRQRMLLFLAVLALVVFSSSLYLRELNFGASELKFIADIGFGAMAFFGSVLAIVATAQLFFSEIEHRTAHTLLAKPVRRSELVLGKYAGVLVVLTLFVALVGGAVTIALLWRTAAWSRVLGPSGDLVIWSKVATFVGLQWLKLAVLVALTMLIASFASTNLFTVAVAFLALVICHLQYIAREAWQRLDQPLARLAAGFIGLVFPNFQVFNLGSDVTAGNPVPAGAIVSASAYGLAYVAVLLALAAFAFRRREF